MMRKFGFFAFIFLCSWIPVSHVNSQIVDDLLDRAGDILDDTGDLIGRGIDVTRDFIRKCTDDNGEVKEKFN